MDKNQFKQGVRWGVIGVGDVCEVKSAPAMNLIEGSKLVAVMRRDGEKAADYAQRHGVPKWYDDADALINDPEINAIYIATPPNMHEFYTLKAATAGKAVYVEKPMARTHQECLNMVAACEKAGVPLFVAYYRRCLPVFQKVKELLDNGVIGDVRFVDIKIHKPLQPDIVQASGKPNNWRIEPEVAGGGYFYDLGSHQLDLMDYFFGAIEKAHGFATNQAGQYLAEDLVLGTFQFVPRNPYGKNSILGQGSWCFNAPLPTVSEQASSETEMITIYGSKGEIAFPCFSNFHISLKIDGKRKKITTFDMPKHVQQPLIQTIVDALQGKGICPSTGISGARTNWVLEQICPRID